MVNIMMMEHKHDGRNLRISIFIFIVFPLCGYLLGGGGWSIWQMVAPHHQPVVSSGKADDLLLWLNPIALLIFQGRSRGESEMALLFVTPVIGILIGLATAFLFQKLKFQKTKVLIVAVTVLLVIVASDVAISFNALKVAKQEISELQR